jgi:hypothetical protein
VNKAISAMTFFTAAILIFVPSSQVFATELDVPYWQQMRQDLSSMRVSDVPPAEQEKLPVVVDASSISAVQVGFTYYALSTSTGSRTFQLVKHTKDAPCDSLPADDDPLCSIWQMTTMRTNRGVREVLHSTIMNDKYENEIQLLVRTEYDGSASYPKALKFPFTVPSSWTSPPYEQDAEKRGRDMHVADVSALKWAHLRWDCERLGIKVDYTVVILHVAYRRAEGGGDEYTRDIYFDPSIGIAVGGKVYRGKREISRRVVYFTEVRPL